MRDLWEKIHRRFVRDKLAMISVVIIAAYVLAGILALLGILAPDYAKPIGEAYAPPSWIHPFGFDVLGRSVWERLVQGIRVALVVGFFSTFIAIPLGTALGLISGYFRGVVDAFVVWLYSTLDSIPTILLLLALALVLPTGKGLATVCIALGVTSWVSSCRVVRGEVIRQKELDYVRAARSLGASGLRILFVHILPNVIHLVLIQASLVFVYSIKSEIILSYLGVGVQNFPSWGVMIDDARLELVGRGVWWQFAAATAALFVLVLAFNIFNDALKDTLDSHKY
ncbi:MAG TPA: ABC transporter permease [Fibrobacteres bacterium]|jgi:ABC-type dipeptide/oligopeptide/nickel transport system permease subunit|nr:ABC transporter permease [Fibrobacterota bacterium]